MDICFEVYSTKDDEEIIHYIKKKLEVSLPESDISFMCCQTEGENSLYLGLGLGYSNNENTRGIEITYSKRNIHSERLAKYLMDYISSFSGFMNRGITEVSMRPDLFIRFGYMTNISDRKRLEDDKTKDNIVWGILTGLREYLPFFYHNQRQNFIM